MAILSSDEYPAIRAALDTELNTTTLPDSTIALIIYQSAADQDVLNLDPDAESRTGEDANHVLRAAIFFCAARLAPAVVRLTSLAITTRDMSYSKPVFDPDEMAEILRRLAHDEMDEVLGTDTDYSGFEVGVLQSDYQQTDYDTDLA